MKLPTVSVFLASKAKKTKQNTNTEGVAIQNTRPPTQPKKPNESSPGQFSRTKHAKSPYIPLHCSATDGGCQGKKKNYGDLRLNGRRNRPCCLMMDYMNI